MALAQLLDLGHLLPGQLQPLQSPVGRKSSRSESPAPGPGLLSVQSREGAFQKGDSQQPGDPELGLFDAHDVTRSFLGFFAPAPMRLRRRFPTFALWFLLAPHIPMQRTNGSVVSTVLSGVKLTHVRLNH